MVSNDEQGSASDGIKPDANDANHDDPRNGGALQQGTVTSVTGGGSRALGNAPNNTSSDWIILVRKSLGLQRS